MRTLKRLPRKEKKKYKKEIRLYNAEFFQFLSEQSEEEQELIKNLLLED